MSLYRRVIQEDGYTTTQYLRRNPDGTWCGWEVYDDQPTQMEPMAVTLRELPTGYEPVTDIEECAL